MSDLLVEYVIGWRRWRRWRMEAAPGLHELSRPNCSLERQVEEGLFALTRTDRWTPGWNEARCRPDFDLYTTMLGDKGESDMCWGLCSAKCTCGLYAYHGSGPDAHPMFSTVFKQGRVLGLVLAYGKMAVHHNGFRAQYAKPLVLVRLDSDRTRAQRVADDYGIPLADTPGEAHGFALKHGQPVPESLRPEEPEHALPMAQARARAFQRQKYFQRHARLLPASGYRWGALPTWTVEKREANQ